MAWEENSCISLNMQLIAILSRIGVYIYISAAKLLIYRRIGIFIKYHKLFIFSLCRFL